ncbi:LysR family transcriptional regulator [Acetobacter sp. DsW_063]|uniref:LysR family transcriptional regulator n=1 Tax=Acetobacter sp. DsW_063 TaxID=1514894 RepID=UPI000A3B6D02|nr:LysR family transcriptional regulator [Acetobacter sp. DsW_063]OUJ14779.1 hypothetical protein HK28_11525 [Acetobacter sp. DsW_063]
MDRIDLFRIFVRVADAASFSRAAGALNMPRSSVSAAIMELEARLGVRLLSRTTRSVSVTPDGRLFYEHCQRLIADMEEAEALFLTERNRVRGVLRVSLPGRIGRLIVAPALPDFLERYSDVDIDLDVTDRVVNLVEDGADCVLRVGALQDSALVARKMGMLCMANVASPAYLARKGQPRTPHELIGHDAVRYASPSNGRVETWEWKENGRLHSIALSGRVTVNSAEAMIACCIAGLGVAQAPLYDVRSHIDRGELIEILSDYPAEAMPMTLLYPHRRHLSGRLHVFADWLDALLRPHLGCNTT